MPVPLQTRRQVHPWRRLHKVQCSVCYHTPVRKQERHSPSTKICIHTQKKLFIDLVIPQRSKWPAGCLTGPHFHTLLSHPPHLSKPKTFSINTDYSDGSHTHIKIKLEHTSPVGGRFYSLLFAWWFLLEFINSDLV